jgi:hypothetical protein
MTLKNVKPYIQALSPFCYPKNHSVLSQRGREILSKASLCIPSTHLHLEVIPKNLPKSVCQPDASMILVCFPFVSAKKI